METGYLKAEYPRACDTEWSHVSKARVMLPILELPSVRRQLSNFAFSNAKEPVSGHQGDQHQSSAAENAKIKMSVIGENHFRMTALRRALPFCAFIVVIVVISIS